MHHFETFVTLRSLAFCE